MTWRGVAPIIRRNVRVKCAASENPAAWAAVATDWPLARLLGAIGLMVPWALPAAVCGLIALLVAMFPADVHAARHGLSIAGRRATPLPWRVPLQLFWIAALWWVR
jgi:uncharacterized membrane protein